MHRNALLLILSIYVSSAFAQQGVRPTIITGDVVSSSESRIVLKTAAGNVDVEISQTTEFKKLLPTDPRPSAAVAAAFTDILVGDRLAVSGFPSDDKLKHAARTVYLMTKDDISQRNQADAQRWASRGISGRVATTNNDTGQITMEVRGLMGTQNVTVTPRSGAKFLRYRQDSVQYSEAVLGTLANIQPGDMIRALGDRSSDGLSFTAEEIITGAFKTVAGTVKAVNEAGTEITITELQTNKEVTVSIGRGSALKRFPQEMAMRMAGGGMGQNGQPGQAPAGGPPAGRVPGAGGQPGSGQQAGGQARPGMGGGAPRGGIDDMFERFPTIAAADLKVGDMVAVSSSKNGSDDKITAIKLLAGVEPFIRAAQMQQSAGGRGGRGGGAQGSGFTIPGLDGFDFP